MLIEINDTVTIRNIQEAFSGRFPYLQINFFIHPPDENGLFKRIDLIPIDKPVSNIRKTHVSALLEIEPENTIADVENELWLRWGFYTQILRRYDTRWILPGYKDKWTLQQQNDTAEKDAATIIHPEYDSRIEDKEY